MTIIEEIKTEEQIIKEHTKERLDALVLKTSPRKRELLSAYGKKHRKRLNEYHRRYYAKHRYELREKAILKAHREMAPRFCKWCGTELPKFPRNLFFCNDTHKKQYRKKYRKEWWLKKRLKQVSEVSVVQHTKVSAPQS